MLGSIFPRVKGTLYGLKSYSWLLIFATYLFYAIYASPKFYQWCRISRFVQNIETYSQMIPNKLIKKEKFMEFADRLKLMEDPPYIIMFEAASIDMVKNHICNLKYFKGAWKRLAAVALDAEAETNLAQIAPEIPVVMLPFAQDEIPANTEYRGILVKQLVYVLRARISQTLSRLGDTIWTENFAFMLIEHKYNQYDLLFDAVGNENFYDFYTFAMNWFCGATFFVNGGSTTANFFQNVEQMLLTKPFYPDSAIMTYLCGHNGYKCGVLPRSTVSCSSYFETDNRESPALLQIDLFANEPKLILFKENNMSFLEKDGTCNWDAVKNLKNTVLRAFKGNRRPPEIIPFWWPFYDMFKLTFKWDSYSHHLFLRYYEYLFS